MENLSQAPHILRGARDGWKLGRSPKVEDYMMTNLQDMTCGLFMAQTSDELCRARGVTREEIDAFAALSHARTSTSIDTMSSPTKSSPSPSNPDGAKRC